MSESGRDIVVVGAGVAGLSAALALDAKGFRVTVLERDHAPPPIGTNPTLDAEIDWRRRGVPHSVHPHFFMGRLRRLLLERHPRLLEQMRAAGVGERRFEDHLHPFHRGRYRPEPGDEVLIALGARRTSFERLLRQYVEEEKLATLISDANVTGLALAEGESPLRVRGVDAEVGGVAQRFEADVVIDATGRTGRLYERLERAGARFAVEHHDCRLLYFTRWYRLRPGREFPTSAGGLPAQLFPDFIAGALPADNGAFTVTLQIHEGDDQFIALAKDADRFQALCERLSGLEPWVSAENAEPLGGVHGFGMMDAFWRTMVVDGQPQVSGFFFLGDTAIRSNPKFGRGCTWSAVAAHLLADILAETRDPGERVLRYQRALEREFRADWRTMLAHDRSMRRQFEVAAGLRRATLRDRFVALFDARVNEALTVDPTVFRAVWSGYHGITEMAAWTRRPAIWLRLLRLAALGPGEFRSVLEELRWRPSREEIFAIQPSRGGSP